MQPVLRSFIFSCALALAGAGASGLPPTSAVSAQSSILAERESLAAELIAQTLRLTRIEDIYSELRYAARELYLPYYESLAEKLKESGADPQQIENARALSDFIGYSIKAADELDPVLSVRGDEIVADYAGTFARHLSSEEMRLIEDFLETPAARKFGNVVYAYSRILTGYTKAEFRSLDEIAELALGLDIEMKGNPFDPESGPPPSPDRIAKAGAIVSDLFRIMRLDDMVGDIVRFGNETLMNMEGLTPDERGEIENGIQQLQFYYNLGKSIATAVAPSALASAASLEDLDRLHRIVLSPVFAKGFSLLEGVIRELTSFTAQDLNEVKTLGERADAMGERGDAEDEALEAELEALSRKWSEELMASLSPETRLGLESSAERLSGMAEEGRRRFRKFSDENELDL